MKPRILTRILFSLGVMLACNATVRAGQNSKPEPVIVCLGDSITRAGYPEELARLVKAQVINAGINGSTSRAGLMRLSYVLTNNPQVVVACFGANDSRLDAPKTQVSPAEYESNLVQIVQKSMRSGARILLATPPPIDPEPYYQRHAMENYAPVGGLENWLQQYRKIVLKVAREKQIPVVDLTVLLAKQPSWRKPDGVHPTLEGNRIIAELLAKELTLLLREAGESEKAGS